MYMINKEIIYLNPIYYMVYQILLNALNKQNKCSSILHVCMNTRKGRAKFNNFLILLDSGCSSTIFMRSLIMKLKNKEDVVMKWQT